MLENDFEVFSAYGSCCSTGISLLIGRSLNAIVDLVFADDKGRLVVADVAVKRFMFWVVTVYAPNSISDNWSHSLTIRNSFSGRLECDY